MGSSRPLHGSLAPARPRPDLEISASRQQTDLANDLAPEHIQIMLETPAELRAKLRNDGSLFMASADRDAEVFADYGAGPNHILPTAGMARRRAGLSVLDFLRIRTSIEIDECQLAHRLIRDAAGLAALEDLPGRARAATIRQESTADASPQLQSLDNQEP